MQITCSLKTYKEELKNNKFYLLDCTDMSANWTKFTQNRLLNLKKLCLNIFK